jgi:hypothetical protein
MFLSDLSGGENNWKKKSLCWLLEAFLMSVKSGYRETLALFGFWCSTWDIETWFYITG